MSRDSEIILLLSDVHERVVRIETRMDYLQETAALVKKHDEDIIKARTSLKILRWVSGLMFIGLPAAIAAAIKILKP